MLTVFIIFKKWEANALGGPFEPEDAESAKRLGSFAGSVYIVLTATIDNKKNLVR
jgi:hypothetical protein